MISRHKTFFNCLHMLCHSIKPFSFIIFKQILLFFTVNFYIIKVAGCICISHPERLTEHYWEADNFVFFLLPSLLSTRNQTNHEASDHCGSRFMIALGVLTSQWDLNNIETNEQEK